jgi:hypothetical protein
MPEDDAAKEALSHFGQFLMENLRDRAVETFDRLGAGKIRAPKVQKLQRDLEALGKAGVGVARRAMVKCVDSAIHDFLFKLQEQADFGNEIQVLVRGVNVVEASDGIHGEPFAPDGWQARFSKYGDMPDEA